MSIVGAPHVKAEHLPVFACSMGDNVIHYMGHVRMMAAAQPFISGAISKTINMPESSTVEDVEDMHMEAWKSGLKAVAIYRDNCKVAQPLSTTKKESDAILAGSTSEAAGPATVVERIVERIIREPVRQKLPRTRQSKTFEFRVADCKGFVTVGEYDDGRPGRSSCGCRSRAPPSPASWTPSPSRSATACNTACRCGPSSRCSRTCGSSPRA
jgi:ribonucleoside-diphosphate reductase alpha chain